MPSPAHTFCGINRRLDACLSALVPRPGQPVIAKPEHMAALLSELLRAGAALRAEPLLPKGNDLELDAEMERYRSHVERLRDLLPSIHSQLLAERARLEGERSRVHSAAAWARASRQTL